MNPGKNFLLTLSAGRLQHRPQASRQVLLSSLILDHILFLASADDDFCAKGPANDCAKVARVAAQVCRHWRETALKTPSIWLGPVLSWYSQPSWLQVVLERSKPLPFNAVIPLGAILKNFQILEVILEHLPRIRQLDLTLRPVAWQKLMQTTLLQQHAPCLQSFSLNIIDVEAGTPTRLSEQDNLFADSAPMLRHLRIENSPIKLMPNFHPGLRLLSLNKVLLISPVQLLNGLRDMNHLEHFYLIHNPGSPHFIPDISPVHLPNLKQLQISESISVCAGIFKNLRLPSSCSIGIGCHHAYDGQYLREILSSMEDSLSMWAFEPLIGGQFVHLGTTRLKLRFVVNGPKPETGESRIWPWDHPYIRLTLSWSASPKSLNSLFSLFPMVHSTFQRYITFPDTLLAFNDGNVPDGLYPPLTEWSCKMKAIRMIDCVDIPRSNECPLPCPIDILPHSSNRTDEPPDLQLHKPPPRSDISPNSNILSSKPIHLPPKSISGSEYSSASSRTRSTDYGLYYTRRAISTYGSIQSEPKEVQDIQLGDKEAKGIQSGRKGVQCIPSWPKKAQYSNRAEG